MRKLYATIKKISTKYVDKTEGLPGRIRDLITLIDNRESESTMKIFESTNNESFSALSKIGLGTHCYFRNSLP